MRLLPEHRYYVLVNNSDGQLMGSRALLGPLTEPAPADMHWERTDKETFLQVHTVLHRARKDSNGKFVVDPPGYAELRRKEFPRVALQLEALWDAMDTGEIPKAKKFYDDIKKTKDKYPKP
mgnify:CR=1 FL=1